MSQQTKILNLLDGGIWVCTSYMYAQFIADPRTRLVELKKQGHNLIWRWCENPDHRHNGQMKEWRLESMQNLTQPMQKLSSHAVYGCPSWNAFKIFCPDCREKVKQEVKQTTSTLF